MIRWIWMGLGALVAVPLVGFPAMLYGAAKEKSRLRNELVAERIVTQEKIGELDEIVFNADESALCDLLGGC